MGDDRLNVKAVLIGWLMAILGSTIVITLFTELSHVTFPLDELAWHRIITCSIFGLIMATLGGYSGALIAKREEAKHALVVGVMVELIYLWVVFILKETTKPPSLTPVTFATALKGVPLWYRLLASILIIPCTLLGGYLKKVGRALRRPKGVTALGCLLAVHGALGLHAYIWPSSGPVGEHLVRLVGVAVSFGWLMAGISGLLLKQWGRILSILLAGLSFILVVWGLGDYFMRGYFGYFGFEVLARTSLLAWYGLLFWFFNRQATKVQFQSHKITPAH